MRENWTDKLPSLMEGHEEAAPEGLWDAVQAGLAPSRPRTRVVWWPYATLVAAAAAGVLAVFLWKPAPVALDTPLSAVPEELVADVPVSASDVFVLPSDGVPAPTGEQKTPILFTGSRKTPTGEQKTPNLCPDSEKSPTGEQKEAFLFTDPVESTGDSLAVKQEETPKEDPQEIRDAFPEVWPEEPAEKPGRKAGKLQLTLMSGGTLLAQSAGGVTQGYGVPYNPGMGKAVARVQAKGITTEMLSRNRESQTWDNHRRVLRVSLGANYGFAPRWSIGSGLTYSILRSDYTTLSGTTETQTVRYLHYLGVPLNVQFQAWEWKALSVYVSAGPMVETAMGARVETHAYVSGQPASDQVETVACRDWRWSLNAGAGAQLRLFRYGSLFVQPGVSWHIPNGSDVESCYSERPVAFEFDFGLRFHF